MGKQSEMSYYKEKKRNASPLLTHLYTAIQELFVNSVTNTSFTDWFNWKEN